MDFEENDLYEAFGLEQPAVPAGGTPDPYGSRAADGSAAPAGGTPDPYGSRAADGSAGERDPEAAEPGEPNGQDTELDAAPPEAGGDGGQEGNPQGQTKEQPPQGGAPEPQTAAQRRENAARRRREEQQAAIQAAVEKALEEERARSKADIAAFFTRAGMKNSLTGQPITTLEEFEAWQRDYAADKAAKDLKAGKLTPEALQTVVEQTPALQELRKQQEQRAAADAEQKRAAAQAQVDREIAEIHKLDPAINSVQDLLSMENARDFYAAVKRGNSFLDAYRLVNFDRLTAARAEAAKQQALNNARGKDHLTGVRPPQGTGAATVPKDEMEAFKLFNPDASEAEITAWYNKHRNV